MKKWMLTLVLLIGIGAASFHSPVKNWVRPEQTINKSIDLNVSAGSAYQLPAYKNSKAALQVTLLKVKGKKTEVLWENEYPELELKKFPLTQSFTQRVRIANVADKKEQVFVHYTIVYKSKKSVLKIQRQKPVAKGPKDEVEIVI